MRFIGINAKKERTNVFSEASRERYRAMPQRQESGFTGRRAGGNASASAVVPQPAAEMN